MGYFKEKRYVLLAQPQLTVTVTAQLPDEDPGKLSATV